MWLHEGEHLDMVQMGDILLGMLCVGLRGKMACVREKLTGRKEGVLKEALKGK